MKTLTVIFLLFILYAQSNDRIQRTWKGPDISAIWELLRDKNAPSPQNRSNTMTVHDGGRFGCGTRLADAFGSSAEQRAAVLQAFIQIKQDYEVAVAKEGKSNNVAAAMAFFIASNVVAYHQTEMPSDADTTTCLSRCNRRW
jgi:hypothetical protein